MSFIVRNFSTMFWQKISNKYLLHRCWCVTYLNLLLSNTWTECCCMYWWRNVILAVGNNVMMDERLDFSSQCHQRCSSFVYFYWVMEFMICIILTNHLRWLPWGVKPLGTPTPPLSFLLCPSGLQICLAGRRHRSAPVVSANNDKDVMVFRGRYLAEDVSLA